MPPSETSDSRALSSKKILLDSPTAMPALGYREIGQAFATIISESQPRFSIGIFGGWGSGKTTLMKAIKTALIEDSLVIVDFNAWRFEREPHLLVPLLDTIRAGLVRWSEPRNADTQEKLRSTANRIGRVVRALATGLSAEVGLPGAAKVSYDVGSALDALSVKDKPESAQSLYVAAFHELEMAFDEFAAGGVTRVVVFVDDLDRCLPGNALDLLESMKLFFDLPGFVFVVGLDEDVVQRAIRAKFGEQEENLATREDHSTGTAALASQRLGREYVKKIFQVPYSLPAMVPQQLDDLLEAMYSEAVLSTAQLRDLQERVRPYLEYVAVARRVNPREVKRFINAYTLQTLVRPELDSDTVLALQTLVFRYEWNMLYEAILADSSLFIRTLGSFRKGEDSAFKDLSADLRVLPTSLADYLRSALAEPLIRHNSLDTYLSSLQSTRSSESWASEAYRQVTQLRRELRNVLSEGSAIEVSEPMLNVMTDTARNLEPLLDPTPNSEISASLVRLPRRILEIASELAGSTPNSEEFSSLLSSMQELLENAIQELQRLRASPAFQL